MNLEQIRAELLKAEQEILDRETAEFGAMNDTQRIGYRLAYLDAIANVAMRLGVDLE